MVDVKEIELYDLEADESETMNVANEHPEIVEKIKTLADEMRGGRLGGDSLRDMEAPRLVNQVE